MKRNNTAHRQKSSSDSGESEQDAKVSEKKRTATFDNWKERSRWKGVSNFLQQSRQLNLTEVHCSLLSAVGSKHKKSLQKAAVSSDATHQWEHYSLCPTVFILSLCLRWQYPSWQTAITASKEEKVIMSVLYTTATFFMILFSWFTEAKKTKHSSFAVDTTFKSIILLHV